MQKAPDRRDREGRPRNNTEAHSSPVWSMRYVARPAGKSLVVQRGNENSANEAHAGNDNGHVCTYVFAVCIRSFGVISSRDRAREKALSSVIEQ